MSEHKDPIARIIRKLIKWLVAPVFKWLEPYLFPQPFHSWLLAYVTHKSQQLTAGEGWLSFHECIEDRIKKFTELKAVLALCGRKNTNGPSEGGYYKLFFKASENDVYVARIFKTSTLWPITPRCCRMPRAIKMHRECTTMHTMQAKNKDVRVLETEYPGILAQLMFKFGFVVFCYKNGCIVVVTHEGIGNSNYYVFDSSKSSLEKTLVDELCRLYVRFCEWSEHLPMEGTDPKTAEICGKVKGFLRIDQRGAGAQP